MLSVTTPLFISAILVSLIAKLVSFKFKLPYTDGVIVKLSPTCNVPYSLHNSIVMPSSTGTVNSNSV